MKRVVIFGNSGSGKSTLAKEYSAKYNLAHLDLDTLAWDDALPTKRREFKSSAAEIDTFQLKNKKWVIEGCYSDLLQYSMRKAAEIVLLNPGVEFCIQNSRARPWESHKYRSKEEQDNNLSMLIEWIKQYPVREDEFSLNSHRRLYEEFVGVKTELKFNTRKA